MGAYQCKLGTLDRAIMLVRSATLPRQLKWRISISSFLPFTDPQYNKAFDDPEECATYAEGIVLEWLNSLSPLNIAIDNEHQNIPQITST